MKTSHNMYEAVVGPQFNQYLLDELKEVFSPITIGPTDKIEKIMYISGQQSVVDWLINRIENEQ